MPSFFATARPLSSRFGESLTFRMPCSVQFMRMMYLAMHSSPRSVYHGHSVSHETEKQTRCFSSHPIAPTASTMLRRLLGIGVHRCVSFPTDLHQRSAVPAVG